jgi:AcrR family transcriptional regulator
MRSLDAAHARAEARVQEFLEAAYSLIDERGSADFTIREVVDKSGQSVRAFYQCFEGKDELLLALFEDSVLEQADDLRKTVEDESDSLARLRAFTVRLYDWCEPSDSKRKPGRHQHHPIAEFAVRLSTVDPARAELAMRPVSQLLQELLDDAVAAGAIRSTDTERAAVIVKQLVMYSWFRNRTGVGASIRISADEIWDFCLHGLGA